MADISQIKLPNGDTYNLVDETSGYITGAKYVKIIEPSGPSGSYTCSDTYDNIKAALNAQLPIKAFIEESGGRTHELLLYDTYFDTSNNHNIGFIRTFIHEYGGGTIYYQLSPQNVITVQERALPIYDGTVE